MCSRLTVTSFSRLGYEARVAAMQLRRCHPRSVSGKIDCALHRLLVLPAEWPATSSPARRAAAASLKVTCGPSDMPRRSPAAPAPLSKRFFPMIATAVRRAELAVTACGRCASRAARYRRPSGARPALLR